MIPLPINPQEKRAIATELTVNLCLKWIESGGPRPTPEQVTDFIEQVYNQIYKLMGWS